MISLCPLTMTATSYFCCVLVVRLYYISHRVMYVMNQLHTSYRDQAVSSNETRMFTQDTSTPVSDSTRVIEHHSEGIQLTHDARITSYLTQHAESRYTDASCTRVE